MVEKNPIKPKMYADDLGYLMRLREKEIKDKYRRTREASGSPATDEEVEAYYAARLAEIRHLKKKRTTLENLMMNQ